MKRVGLVLGSVAVAVVLAVGCGDDRPVTSIDADAGESSSGGAPLGVDTGGAPGGGAPGGGAPAGVDAGGAGGAAGTGG